MGKYKAKKSETDRSLVAKIFLIAIMFIVGILYLLDVHYQKAQDRKETEEFNARYNKAWEDLAKNVNRRR